MTNHTNCSVEERLQYLEETKNLIMNSINNIGGELTDTTPFSEYPIQLGNLIDNSIVSQAKLNDLTLKVINIK